MSDGLRRAPERWSGQSERPSGPVFRSAPGEREDAWLPGLAEPVPDHPHFPKLVEAIRTMREREAWVTSDPDDARPDDAPRALDRTAPDLRWPPLAMLLIGIGIGSLTTIVVAQRAAPEDVVVTGTLQPVPERRAPAGAAGSMLPGELLGAGRAARANESDGPAPAPTVGPVAMPAEPRIQAVAEVIEQPIATGFPDPPDPVEIDRRLGHALYELGQRQQARGDVEAALRSYTRAAALAPDHAQTFYDWGWLLQQKGDASGAIEKYRTTIELEPQHPFAHYNLGYLMQRAGDVTGAQIVYENALAAGAANALTLYNLGWLMQKAGDDAAAVQHYEAALAEDPGHALAHYNLGYLLQKGGEAGRAAEHYRKALESDPALSNAEQGLQAVKETPAAQ